MLNFILYKHYIEIPRKIYLRMRKVEESGEIISTILMVGQIGRAINERHCARRIRASVQSGYVKLDAFIAQQTFAN